MNMNLENQDHNVTTENKRFSPDDFVWLIPLMLSLVACMIIYAVITNRNQDYHEYITCEVMYESFPDLYDSIVQQGLTQDQFENKIRYILEYWQSPTDMDQYVRSIDDLQPLLELSEAVYHNVYYGFDLESPLIASALERHQREDGYQGIAEHSLIDGLNGVRWLYYLKQAIVYYEQFGTMVGFLVEAPPWGPGLDVDYTVTVLYPSLLTDNHLEFQILYLNKVLVCFDTTRGSE